jgi:hypothetical protein
MVAGIDANARTRLIKGGLEEWQTLNVGLSGSSIEFREILPDEDKDGKPLFRV